MTPAKASSKPRPDYARLFVAIGGETYTAAPICPERSEVIRAWRLRKLDGTTYIVADTSRGAVCDCADSALPHEGNDLAGCQHVRSLRALGLIDDGSQDATRWVPWPDAYTHPRGD